MTQKYNLFIVCVMTLFFLGCSDTSVKKEHQNCPKCNMVVKELDPFSAKLYDGSKTLLFDDIGCVFLWAKEQQIPLEQKKIEVFANDTKKYIDAQKAYFNRSDKTPMNYGFGAYEHNDTGKISIEEVRVKMLRGEHMANPKIRKQLLGN